MCYDKDTADAVMKILEKNGKAMTPEDVAGELYHYSGESGKEPALFVTPFRASVLLNEMTRDGLLVMLVDGWPDGDVEKFMPMANVAPNDLDLPPRKLVVVYYKNGVKVVLNDKICNRPFVCVGDDIYIKNTET